jgi:transposase-like protein
MVDATYFKARENHRIVSKAFMVALAIKSDGHREVVGFDVYDAEDDYSWKRFLEDLKQRGLQTPHVMISDAHRSIRKAMAEVFPQTAWQRCQVHFMRNILNETPPKYKEGLKVELREMFNAGDIKEARKRRDSIIDDYGPVAEKAMKILDEGFEDSMTLINMPQSISRILRTTNILERLNRELKRRSDVIQVFPNGASVLRLMGAVTIEYSDRQSTLQRIFAERTFKEIREKLSGEYRLTAQRQNVLLKAV